MLFYCWAYVENDGPTLKQHWVNVSCLLGMYKGMYGCAVISHANTWAQIFINHHDILSAAKYAKKSPPCL